MDFWIWNILKKEPKSLSIEEERNSILIKKEKRQEQAPLTKEKSKGVFVWGFFLLDKDLDIKNPQEENLENYAWKNHFTFLKKIISSEDKIKQEALIKLIDNFFVELIYNNLLRIEKNYYQNVLNQIELNTDNVWNISPSINLKFLSKQIKNFLIQEIKFLFDIIPSINSIEYTKDLVNNRYYNNNKEYLSFQNSLNYYTKNLLDIIKDVNQTAKYSYVTYAKEKLGKGYKVQILNLEVKDNQNFKFLWVKNIFNKYKTIFNNPNFDLLLNIKKRLSNIDNISLEEIISIYAKLLVFNNIDKHPFFLKRGTQLKTQKDLDIFAGELNNFINNQALYFLEKASENYLSKIWNTDFIYFNKNILNYLLQKKDYSFLWWKIENSPLIEVYKSWGIIFENQKGKLNAWAINQALKDYGIREPNYKYDVYSIDQIGFNIPYIYQKKWAFKWSIFELALISRFYDTKINSLTKMYKYFKKIGVDIEKFQEILFKNNEITSYVGIKNFNIEEKKFIPIQEIKDNERILDLILAK